MDFLTKITNCLKDNEIKLYALEIIEKTDRQIFFIGDKVDMSRCVLNTSAKLTLYVDYMENDVRYLGSANTTLEPTLSEEEMEDKVLNLKNDARLVHNKYYILAAPCEFITEEKQSVKTSDVLEKIAKGILSVETKENEKINSFEIFVTQNDIHLLTSSGIDYKYSAIASNIEVIINVNDQKHEIEIFYEDKFGAKDVEEIKDDLTRIFKQGQDRLIAKPLSDIKCSNVIITGSDMKEVVTYFAYQCNAQPIYSKIFETKMNESIYQKTIIGDKVTLSAKKHLNNSSALPFNSDGMIAKNFDIIKDGVCKNYVGNIQFLRYLDTDLKTATNFILAGGKNSEKDLKKEPYLECVEFSDFQIDPMSGNFAGEIRLAYYFDGEKITPVSGGSVSGQFKDLKHEIYFASETKQFNNYIVPVCVLIKNTNITIAD